MSARERWPPIVVLAEDGCGEPAVLRDPAREDAEAILADDVDDPGARPGERDEDLVLVNQRRLRAARREIAPRRSRLIDALDGVGPEHVAKTGLAITRDLDAEPGKRRDKGLRPDQLRMELEHLQVADLVAGRGDPDHPRCRSRLQQSLAQDELVFARGPQLEAAPFRRSRQEVAPRTLGVAPEHERRGATLRRRTAATSLRSQTRRLGSGLIQHPRAAATAER